MSINVFLKCSKQFLTIRNTNFALNKKYFSTTFINNDSNNAKTIFQIRKDLQDLIGYDISWEDGTAVDKNDLAKNLPKSQSELKPVEMRSDYSETIIPLGDEPIYRNRYGNFQKLIRFGRILEDLDTLAVHISYNFNKDQNVKINNRTISPIVIVTGLVDRIEVDLNDIKLNKNIKLSGYTSWVGRSSNEVTMKLKQEVEPGVWKTGLNAKFVMCARDSINKGSAIMNPLKLVTDRDYEIFEQGEVSKIDRHEQIQESLFKNSPSIDESDIVHKMFLDTIDLKYN
jgi:acyl-coenzyme A thioesterase 9